MQGLTSETRDLLGIILSSIAGNTNTIQELQAQTKRMSAQLMAVHSYSPLICTYSKTMNDNSNDKITLGSQVVQLTKNMFFAGYFDGIKSAHEDAGVQYNGLDGITFINAMHVPEKVEIVTRCSILDMLDSPSAKLYYADVVQPLVKSCITSVIELAEVKNLIVLFGCLVGLSGNAYILGYTQGNSSAGHALKDDSFFAEPLTPVAESYLNSILKYLDCSGLDGRLICENVIFSIKGFEPDWSALSHHYVPILTSETADNKSHQQTVINFIGISFTAGYIEGKRSAEPHYFKESGFLIDCSDLYIECVRDGIRGNPEALENVNQVLDFIQTKGYDESVFRPVLNTVINLESHLLENNANHYFFAAKHLFILGYLQAESLTYMMAQE